MKKLILSLLCAVLCTTGIFAANEVTVTGSLGQDATYSTLTGVGGAFEALNAADQTGKTITIAISASTTSEDGTNSLTGAAGMWTSLTIYPTATDVTIGAAVAKPLIDLNGADNVTINGAVGNAASGKSMIITNTSNVTTAGTSTIRFINDATGNTVKNCIIKGATIDPAAGVVFFSSATATGNDTNVIENNDITNSSTSGAGTAADRPINALYSAGTATFENSGITITNNNFFNLLRLTTASKIISLFSNTTDCSITGNSFYETTNFTPTSGGDYSVINVAATTGVNFTISGNYIGGQSALCGGNAWTKTAQNGHFTAIYLTVGATVSNIQGNTIKNFNWTNSNNGNFKGIEIVGASVANVGTTSGNTISDISMSNAGNAAGFFGINITTSGAIDCQNNTITNISTTSTAATNAVNIYGIQRTGNAATTISINTITNLTANSAASSTTGQSVIGIVSTNSVSKTVKGNIINNLTNNTTNATTTVLGLVNGISCSGSTSSTASDISDNQINDLTIANKNATRFDKSAAIGILANDKYSKLERNTVYNISNTNTGFTGNVVGVYVTGGKDLGNVATVSRNYIFGITNSVATATTDSIFGLKIHAGSSPYFNNVISLTTNSPSAVCGIYETAPGNYHTNNIYFNTVYIGGNPTSGSSNSFALYSHKNNGTTRNIRNNIFYNARSNTESAAGAHYAAYFNYGLTTKLTLGYNDYYAPGTGGVLGYYNSLPCTSVPLIATIDAGSVTTNPGITSPGVTAVSYKGTVSLTGVAISGFTTDYDGANRRVAQMGAFFIPTTVSVSGVTPINSGDLTLTVASQIEVAAGAELTLTNNPNISKIILAPTAKLTMGTNTLTAPNGVVLQSDATGTATLTGDAAVSNATVQQYVTAGRNWYISPSVTAGTSSMLSRGDSVVAWNEGLEKWEKVTSSLTAGRGYIQTAVAGHGTAGTVNFTGTTNAGDVTTPSLTRTGSVATSGFNLVGNPYPSYLRWSGLNSVKKGSIESENRNTGVGSSFWYRTKRNGDNAYIFVTHNGTSGYTIPSGIANTTVTGIIPPMQAFWVLVNEGSSSTTMTFTNDMRLHADNVGNTFKAPKNDERTRLRLQLANGTATDEALIYFDAAAANSFDNYDSPKMMNNSTTMPDLYSKAGSEKLVINGLSEVSDNLVVPLGYNAGAAGELRLKVSEMANFAADTRIYLRDGETETELVQGIYHH